MQTKCYTLNRPHHCVVKYFQRVISTYQEVIPSKVINLNDVLKVTYTLERFMNFTLYVSSLVRTYNDVHRKATSAE